MQPLTFSWRETGERLLEIARADRVTLERDRGRFRGVLDGTQVIFTPPLALAIPPGCNSAGDYLEQLPDRLGTQCLLLLRAGSSALGIWDDDELLAHKVFRRYVVRGHGKAQSAHLKSKGKSRYGSRLRLQNARRLLEETDERLRDWSEEHGGFDRIFVAAPVRLLADLYSTEPPPPFDREAAVRIPWHVHEPSHEELLRCRRRLGRGRIEPAI